MAASLVGSEILGATWVHEGRRGQMAFILDTGTPSVQFLCKRDKRLAKVISMVGGISYVPYHMFYAVGYFCPIYLTFAACMNGETWF